MWFSDIFFLFLSGLFSSLTFFFSQNGSRTCDYQLAVQRYIKKDSRGCFVVFHCLGGLDYPKISTPRIVCTQFVLSDVI